MSEKLTKREMEEKYVKTMIENNLFSVVFAEEMADRTEEKSQELVKEIDSAVGIAKFTNEDGGEYWGILIDKIKEAKKHMEDAPKGEDNDSSL